MANEENASRCWNVETGALIYGIINIIINGLGSIVFFGIIVYVGIQLADSGKAHPLLTNRRTQNELALDMVYLCIVTPLALIALLFAILLVIGVTKKKPAFVLTYFIFGVLVTGLSLAGAIAIQVGQFLPVVAAWSFPLIVIYALPLAFVFLTFKKFRANAMYQPNYDPVHT